MVAVTFHENELENWETELGNSGGCSSCTDTPKKQLLCDFRGKWSDTTHGAFKKVVVAPLTKGDGTSGRRISGIVLSLYCPDCPSWLMSDIAVSRS